MLLVLKRTVSIRRFFWAPKTYVKTDGSENIYNFTLKNFAYLNLWKLLYILIFPKKILCCGAQLKSPTETVQMCSH